MVNKGMAYGTARAVGDWGEDLVARFVAEQGWEVLDRNWRCPAGEIDLVARDGTTLVFVEVKTRRSTRFGSPVEAVTRAKLARLRRLAWTYVKDCDQHTECIRIDVVGILIRRNQRPQLQHLQGVA